MSSPQPLGREPMTTPMDDHRLVEAEYGVVRELETREPGTREASSPAAGSRARRRSGAPRRSRGATARYGVEITVPGACDTCAIKDNCYGAGSLVWAQADEPLAAGDHVRLEMRRGTVLKATAWVYGIPLVAVVLGTVLGHNWLFAARPEEPRVLLSFALGVGLMLAAGFVLAKLNDWIGTRLTIRAHRTA